MRIARPKIRAWPAGNADPVSAKRLGPPPESIDIAGIRTGEMTDDEVVGSSRDVVGAMDVLVVLGAVLAVEAVPLEVVDVLGNVAGVDGLTVADELVVDVELVLATLVDVSSSVEVVDGTLEVVVVVFQAQAFWVTLTDNANAIDKPIDNAMNALKMNPPSLVDGT